MKLALMLSFLLHAYPTYHDTKITNFFSGNTQSILNEASYYSGLDKSGIYDLIREQKRHINE